MAHADSATPANQPQTVSTVRDIFAAPPAEFSSGPLWVWNDWMTEESVRQGLRDLASQHVMQAFVHPRPGLMTPYLSDEWMTLWKAALDEAAKLNMYVWIYDENSYPSGFAGGFVPEAMPESRGQGIVFEEVDALPSDWSTFYEAYQLDSGTHWNKPSASLPPPGKYVLAKQVQAKPSGWFGGKTYVDLLKTGVTDRFLAITLDAYKEAFGDAFGNRMPGSFTDEPHLAPAGGFHWTDDLPAIFESRYGYSLVNQLSALNYDHGDWRRVRHDYYQLLNDLFIERWGKVYYDYCDRNGIAFTGHYWEHEWPNTRTVPDNMAMAAWQHMPGIDILFNQYSEGVHAQFGNVRAVMELASTANQLGHTRRLCETYGGAGWDLRFEDMKRIADWVSVLGVNFINQHLTDTTLRGARKGDYPQSFSYHASWWDAYHVQADYLARLSAVLSHGQQINPMLIIEPTTTVWMYQGPGREQAEQIGEAFQQFVTQLAKMNVEFDLGSESVIAQWGSVAVGKFIVGQRAYSLVVLPGGMENIDGATLALLEGYLAQGGRVYCADGQPPIYVDAQPSDKPATLATSPNWYTPATAPWGGDLATQWQPLPENKFHVALDAASAGIVYHQRRQFADGQLVFLVNTSDTAEGAGAIVCDGVAGADMWDLETGETGLPVQFTKVNTGVRVPFALPPCGSLLIHLSTTETAPADTETESVANIDEAGPMTIHRTQPNVLTLDYVDITAGGETRSDQHYYAAAQFVFQKHGLEANPWDHAVQYRDELISQTFTDDSGFEATFHFVVDDPVPMGLQAVVEQPDLYTITCNGKQVQATPDTWWLDRAFGVIDIGDHVKPGDNIIVLSATPFTLFHELERIYILGDFTLRATDHGFAIAPDAPLAAGPWSAQGSPFYGHGVVYEQTFTIDSPAGSYRVSLPSWYGSVAAVRVNGLHAGYIYHQPYACDVSSLIKAGTNQIEVEVIGTLKNTLGPHHGNPPLGIAAPDMFRKGPMPGPPAAADYHTIGYGLFEPFTLAQATK